MEKFNKGQQALEYLITYGWAFVVVLITIGAFAYFGILNPDQYLPDRCNFGEQLRCVDFFLEAVDGEKGRVQLKFTNNFGENIVVLGIETIEGYGVFCDDASCPPAISGTRIGNYVELPNGQVNAEPIILDLEDQNNLDYALFDGEKTLVPIRINFSRDPTEVPNPPSHVVIGDVYAIAQK